MLTEEQDLSGREQEPEPARRPRRRGMGLLSKAAAAGWVLNTVALALAGIFLIPALVQALGPRLWAHVAVAQSIGALAGVVIGFGWGIAGPVRVAHASLAEQRAEYVQSLIIRVALAVPVVAAAAFIAFAVTGTWSWTIALAVLTVGLVGCGPTWFFVGRAKPFGSLLLDTLPRVLGTVLAIALATSRASAPIIFSAQIFGILLGLLLSTAYVLRITKGVTRGRVSAGGLLRSLSSQLPGVFSALVATLYTTLPITIVAALAPWTLPVYALVDKLQKQVSSSISPVIQILQGYVARASEEQRQRRLRNSFVGVVILSLLGAVGFALIGSEVMRWLSSGKISINRFAVVVLAGTFALILTEQFLSRAVIPRLGLLRSLPVASLTGAVIGLTLVIILVTSQGAAGALLGVAIGLVVTVGLETGIVLKGRSR